MFNCDVKVLAEALYNVGKACASKAAIPAMEGIKFVVEDNVLKLTGYDLEIGMTTEIPVYTDETIEFIVNAKNIVDMVRNLPEETVEFTVEDGLNIKLQSGKVKYTIKGMNTEEYSKLPLFTPETKVTLTQDILKSMIEQTIFSVATSDQKPVLRGELFDIKDGVFNLVSSDNMRLSLRTEKISTEVNYKFVVPSKALAAIAHILQNDNEKEVEFSSNGKHAIFNFNGYTVFTRLIDGEFNNYSALLTNEFKTEVIVSVSEFSKFLSSVTFLISEKAKNYVKCTFENDNINLDFKSNEGNFNGDVEANITGETMIIGVNPKFMLEALKASDCDKVLIKMNGAMKPFVVSPIQGDSFTYLIMPVNIK
ncbi:MAG: DNA polymerase III subunit beta [Oscillospiraceae bacterium]|jgi:DNA polymerase-3 subunit beta|nr:DNA polymerase III subunit beta [Oscillospiraceae bacterium]